MKRKTTGKFQLWKCEHNGHQWVEKASGRQQISGFQRLIAENEDRFVLERLKLLK